MAESFSYLSNTNPAFVENLFRDYQQNPESVPAEWKRFFEGFEFASTQYGEGASPSSDLSSKEINVLNLIHAYRDRGHLFTETNPVRTRRKHVPTLDLVNFDLSEADLDTLFHAGKEVGLGVAKLRDIVAMLQETYCKHIGAEYMYVNSPEIVSWLRQRIEGSRNKPNFSLAKKERILRKVNEAVIFENFLGTKFVGQKRFSLEGAENTIPALDAVIEKGAELGVKEFVLGMAHRGRLNVLANTLQKQHDEIFSEFEGKEHANSVFQGDVKYHMGYSSNVLTSSGNEVHLSLMPNPSHLETVNPVVEGVSRSKIDRKYGKDFRKLCPILIHGDAAVSGQGIVYEVIQMSQLDGYKTGGTLHIVINNQIGFTTNYTDSRSSTYCTDIAKVTQSPVFHVNGDDVEALVFAIELAMEFRQTFQRDVFIDLLCYRRHGHNEADEPSFTQPILYKAIKAHSNPAKIYQEKLIAEGQIQADMVKKLEKELKDQLQAELEESQAKTHLTGTPYLKGDWEGIRRVTNEDWMGEIFPTGVAAEKLTAMAEKMHKIPDGFNAHPKIKKLFEDRLKAVAENKLDWALGEMLAYGTLLEQGYPVRLSGQDCERGTFSHRHAVINDVENETKHYPLNHLSEEQAKFEVYNSLLSEYGVLGFEYGYSFGSPNHLVIWEAQFGDFANGSQIIMDQYISSAETKWQRMSGLVQLLPHGFEGQGPEHSSARLERYLELCANKNMQILNITTPANYFHFLRRQMLREFRIPAVVFSPKKLLRYPLCTSPIEDFAAGGFLELIDDAYADPKKVKKVLFTSGKLYYDLYEQQQKDGRKDVAIVRLEQLYPLPIEQLRKVVERYKNAKEYFWVQEEPRNMGAWSYILRMFTEIKIEVISRKPSPSPATGYPKQHATQQQYLVNRSFDIVPEKVEPVKAK